MKRWVGLIVTMLSGLLCLAAIIFWGDSYRTPWALKHERFVEPQRPWKLRSCGVRIGGGSIYVWVLRLDLFLPPNEPHPDGFTIVSGPEAQFGAPIRPQQEWRGEWAGFGIRKASYPPLPTAQHLYMESALARGLIVQSMGWVDSLSMVRFPCWIVVLLSALLPVRQLYLLIRREKWKQSGRCAGCGYDLRGSGQTCPECGMACGNGAGEETSSRMRR